MNLIDKILKIYTLVCIICVPIVSFSQDIIEEGKQEAPSFKTNRAEEDYSYLKNAQNKAYKEDLADAIKFIPISKNKENYFSIGGQYRPRFEYTNNVDYSNENENYYSQRLNFHTNIVLGKYIRVFGELYHGYTSDQKRLIETDKIDFHQAFVEFKTNNDNSKSLTFRFGRQELALGGSRLVGNREGPNMRRSFDLAKLKVKINGISIISFYGKEVSPQFNAFDNEFSLFNSDASNPVIWSVGTQFPIKNLNGINEVYYLGFKSKTVGFSDIFGEELRHSLGIRRFGTAGKRISYNTEVVYQFGDLGGSTISAMNIETDWKYKFINSTWNTTLGFKFDWSSGDKEQGDDKLQTFNPLFVNPAIYSLAGVNTPANLTSFHPNITVFPTNNMSIFIDYAMFYRTSEADGLYTPPRFQLQQVNSSSEKHIGDAFGIQINYEINRNLSLDIRSTYFLSGKFIKASGDSESIFYFAPTLNYKF